jgi:hypothetical protein
MIRVFGLCIALIILYDRDKISTGLVVSVVLALENKEENG